MDTFLTNFKITQPGKWNKYIHHPWVSIMSEGEIGAKTSEFWAEQCSYFMKEYLSSIISGYKKQTNEANKLAILNWAVSIIDYLNQWKKPKNPQKQKVTHETKQYARFLRESVQKQNYPISRFAFLPCSLGYFDIFESIKKGGKKIPNSILDACKYNVSNIAKIGYEQDHEFANKVYLNSNWKIQKELLKMFGEGVDFEIKFFDQIWKQYETNIKQNN